MTYDLCILYKSEAYRREFEIPTAYNLGTV